MFQGITPTPDRVFVKRIKDVDRKLGIKFYRTHGHFCVTYKRATGQSVPLFMVKADDGGFRQPDQRDFDFLMSGDLERIPAKERFQMVSKYMQDVREKDRKDAKDNIHGATKDGKIQLTNAYARLGGSKANSAFRRITPKTKGKII